MVGGTLVLPLTAHSLADVIEVASQAPDDLGIIALATRLPEDAGAPPVLMLTLVWSGAASEGERMMKSLRHIATPQRDDLKAMTYAEMYRLADGAPLSVTNTTESLFADALDAEAIAAILEAVAGPVPAGVLGAIELRVLGGAMARVPAAATAFAHRQRRLLISAVRAGFPPPHYAQHRAWVVAVADALRVIKRGTYLNFVDLTATDPADVFPTATRGRLAAVKAAVDPENLFSRHISFAAGSS